MSRYSCAGFINFLLDNKRLADSTNLFSPNKFFKNEIILKYFQ